MLDVSAYNHWTWEEIKAKGEPPLPRYHHTMNMFHTSRILVIYGGIDNSKFVNG